MRRPPNNFKYLLFKVAMPAEVISTLKEVLSSGWIGEGKKVKEFENRIRQFVKNPLTLAVNSCTGALMMALRLGKIGAGDEVISTPITCAATNLPILDVGAKIVWADCDVKTGNISPPSIEKRITEKTKAIMVVHWGGVPAELQAIRAIARKYQLLVIEDAAHAFGTLYNKRPIGTHSDFVCFSFQSVKIITTGDGGALCCQDQSIFQRAKKMRWFGIDRDERNLKRIEDVDVTELGLKFHLNDICAAIGLAQLKYLDEILAARRQAAAFYFENLKDVPGLTLISPPENAQPNYWLFTILVEDRESFLKKCISSGIQASPVSKRNDAFSLMKAEITDHDLPGVDFFAERMVCIPNGQWLNEDDLHFIARTIKNGW